MRLIWVFCWGEGLILGEWDWFTRIWWFPLNSMLKWTIIQFPWGRFSFPTRNYVDRLQWLCVDLHPPSTAIHSPAHWNVENCGETAWDGLEYFGLTQQCSQPRSAIALPSPRTWRWSWWPSPVEFQIPDMSGRVWSSGEARFQGKHSSPKQMATATSPFSNRKVTIFTVSPWCKLLGSSVDWASLLSCRRGSSCRNPPEAQHWQNQHHGEVFAWRSLPETKQSLDYLT